MKYNDLKKTTRNSMEDLYRGANPASIKMALRMKPAELKELQQFFGTTDVGYIALQLSMGNYKKD